MALVLGSDGLGGGSTFTTDIVVHGDILTTLDESPNLYANYRCIRQIAHYFNLHHVQSFDLSSATTLVYLHITPNDHTLYRPAFLSAWTYTGLNVTVMIPGRDDPQDSAPSVAATGYFYELAVGSGTFGYDFLPANHEDILSYMPGCFFAAPGINVTAIQPELNSLILDISQPYVKPVRDWLLDKVPDTRPATTLTATSFLDIATKAGSASSGDVIRLPGGIYNDDGTVVLSSLNFDPENPLWIVGGQQTLNGATLPDVDLRGASKFEINGCTGIRFWGFHDTEGSGGSLQRFDMNSANRWVSIENIFWDNSNTDINPMTGHRDFAFTYVSFSGKYCRLASLKVLNKNCRGNAFNHSGVTGDDNGTQFNIQQDIDCDGYNTTEVQWVGQNNAFFRYGGNNNRHTRIHTIVRRCKTNDYNRVPDDAEEIVNKAGGIIFSQVICHKNTNNTADQGLGVRTGTWSVVVGSFVYNKSNSANTLGLTTLGVDPNDPLTTDEYLQSQHVYCRNYALDFDGTQGFLSVQQSVDPHTNRWAGNETVFGEFYSFAQVDQSIRFLANGAPDIFTPSRNHMRRIAIQGTGNAVLEDFDSTLAIDSWKACVFDTADHGFSMSSLPAGVVVQSGNWTARYDGHMFPNNAHFDSFDFIECPPVSLLSDLTGIGTTFDS